MRVISGKIKGRNILGFDISGTRPTMDRVKESVFAMIQDNLKERIVLDLFAGSGNLGIEALSNGALKVYFNDKNKKCIDIIQKNLNNFDLLNNSVITNMDYLKALDYYKDQRINFDLVFLDPPYKEHIISEIIGLLLDYNLLNDNGLVVCEVNNNDIYVNDKLLLYKERSYGNKKVIIYKKIINNN